MSRAYDDFRRTSCTTRIKDKKDGWYAFEETVFYGEKGGMFSVPPTLTSRRCAGIRAAMEMTAAVWMTMTERLSVPANSGSRVFGWQTSPLKYRMFTAVTAGCSPGRIRACRQDQHRPAAGNFLPHPGAGGSKRLFPGRNVSESGSRKLCAGLLGQLQPGGEMAPAPGRHPPARQCLYPLHVGGCLRGGYPPFAGRRHE